MSYIEQISIGSQVVRLLGGLLLVLVLAVLGLTAPYWFHSKTAEYLVFRAPNDLERSAQLAEFDIINERVGCELWGRTVEKDGHLALRFRFPNDPDSEPFGVQCLKAAAPSHYRIEKASWLQTKLHQPKPSWF